MDVWLMGPGNLKQMITEWYQAHPAFAGAGSVEWCKRVKNTDPQDGSGQHCYCYKFSASSASSTHQTELRLSALRLPMAATHRSWRSEPAAAAFSR